MIDGESSKAELLQKVFIWRYDCSYSDAYLIKISPDLTEKEAPINQLFIYNVFFIKALNICASNMMQYRLYRVKEWILCHII